MNVSKKSLQLSKHWTLGEPLGAGGYVEVVAATGEDGTPAAVKMVPKKPGASREMLFVDLALPGQAVRR
jgi:serine/threonine-protein kinase